MKRSPLSRRTPLKPGETELSRAVGFARRAGLAVTSGPRPNPKPKQFDLMLAQAWHEAVVKGARCLVCGSAKHLEGHHLLPKQDIERHARAAGLTNEERNVLLWDPRNGIALDRRCHERHESAYRRVPRYLLPAAAWEFAAELGDWAVVKLERLYPSV